MPKTDFKKLKVNKEKNDYCKKAQSICIFWERHLEFMYL